MLLPKDNAMSLPTFQTVLKGIQVIGSIVGTRADPPVPGDSATRDLWP